MTAATKGTPAINDTLRNMVALTERGLYPKCDGPAVAAFDALTAKAAALDALVEAATVLFHESNTLDGMRGARDPRKVAALTAALSAAKAAQVSK